MKKQKNAFRPYLLLKYVKKIICFHTDQKYSRLCNTIRIKNGQKVYWD